MDFAGIAPFRFGTGLRTGDPVAERPQDLLAALRAGDVMAARYPSVGLAEAMAARAELARLRKARHDSAAAQKALQAYQKGMNERVVEGFRAALARMVEDPYGFRERLVAFWADHFTARDKDGKDRLLNAAYEDGAIRPHVTGRFADMLRAVVTHPLMLFYLDQTVSVGPASQQAKAKKDLNLGLNENLAREIMELHTLGVGGGYAQKDVRQFAELLTGMSVGKDGFRFLPRRAEPGSEEVLGKAYGGDNAGMAAVDQVLGDLARHPDTARHLAQKLVVHFIGDVALDPARGDLVAAMAEAYLRADTGLMPMYEVLLDHPAGRAPMGEKIRWPMEWMAAGLRALGRTGDTVSAESVPRIRQGALNPLRGMGQPYHGAGGPDGWPEDAASWAAPQQLAARISWALQVPRQVVKPLPDPRVFVAAALGARADGALLQAVPRAEARDEAIALVLVSPAFMRR